MISFNGHPIIIRQFPNGESLIDKPFFAEHRKTDGFERNVVTLKYESDADLFQLLLIRKSLWFPCDLEITYFPYSRMDRNSKEYIFTLKSVTKFINWLEWNSVTIYEPHSDVTPALLNHCKVVNLTEKVLTKTDFDSTKDFVLFPDAGAQKKYVEQIKTENQLVGFKNRDFKTGKITDTQVLGPNFAGRRVFIVDDLCSKGGTFVLAAETLKFLGASEIFLVVAHCENTIFKGKIFSSDLVNHVYTTDTLLNPEKYFGEVESATELQKMTIFDHKEL